ncbi:MAG TPA: hypothetical protein EYH45_05775 [Candidatus Caldiarchaeum subterraneum]|uniref:Uncharacterized protein n=1 Tax=Caldiarchaeum subterraneum TaxID=311458 RepID=A0A832ZWD2_CALS0|nr:hypothetical protein [Candidatus Caldarchaeum subterraneum]
MIEEIDSLQKIKILFFAKPHVGLVKHVEGVSSEEAKLRIIKVLERLRVGKYKVVEYEEPERTDIVAELVYNGSKLTIWFVLLERGDVGCVIEIRVYHKMEESAEADEYLSLLSSRLDEFTAGV